MDTPRITRRHSFQADMPTKVRPDFSRSQLFTPDSGIGGTPSPRTPMDIRTGGASRTVRQGMRVPTRMGDGRATEETDESRWSMFWFVWFAILALSCVCVAFTWAYFPENKIVQLSQEYVMKSLLAVIGATFLAVILKVIWVICRREPRRSINPTDIREDDYRDYYRGDYSYGDTSMGVDNLPSRDGYPDVAHGSPNVDYLPAMTPGYTQNPSGKINTPDNVMTTNAAVQSRQDTPHPSKGEREPVLPEENHKEIFRERDPRSSNTASDYPVRRTFSGGSTDVWNEFLQYFENLAELNAWSPEKSRRVLLSTFRGQAETFAYGLPLVFQKDYGRLKQKMEERFGHTAMKERYIADAKLRKRQPGESLRDFGQAIEDLYRRAYPDNPDIVEENAIKAFLDKCGQAEDFRLAVKRTRPKTLQKAVINAIQEECLRVGEKELSREKPANRGVYEVENKLGGMNMVTNADEFPRSNPEGNRYGSNSAQQYRRYPPRFEPGPRGRPYNRGFGRGRGVPRVQEQDGKEPSGSTRVTTEDSDKKPLN